ncbi:MAG TPA: hypothetical protein VD997_15975 [Phycisphaerales bacterium]|nr:hypothetical protein [Phycisphaerales bacterium]
MHSPWPIFLAPLLAILLALTGTLRATGGVLVIPHHHDHHRQHSGGEHHHDRLHAHTHDHRDGGDHHHHPCAALLSCTQDGEPPHTPPHVHLSDADPILSRACIDAAALGQSDFGIDMTLPEGVPAHVCFYVSPQAERSAPSRAHGASSLLRTTRLQV